MAGKGAGPFAFHLRGMGEDRLFPDQSDRQQVGQRRVRLPRQFSLPQKPARMLCPAGQIDQQPVEHRLGGAFRDPQRFTGSQQGTLGGVGGRGHMGAEAQKPRYLGCQVMAGPGAPRGEGPPSRGRCPERLTAVEMPRRPKADGPPDDRGPIRARGARRKDGQCRHGLNLKTRRMQPPLEG